MLKTLPWKRMGALIAPAVSEQSALKVANLDDDDDDGENYQTQGNDDDVKQTKLAAFLAGCLQSED